MRDNMKRRKVLQAIALTATSSGVVAASDAPPDGAEDVGIHERVLELLSNDNTAEAIALLEEHDVPHGFTVDTRGGGPGDEVGTQDVWEKSDAVSRFVAYNVGGNLYQLSLNWTLNGRSDDIDASIPWDAAMIAWEPSRFSWEPDSQEYNVYNVWHDQNRREEATVNVGNNPLFGDVGHGFGIEVGDGEADQPTFGDTEIDGELRGQVTKEGSYDGILGGKYTHTWTLGLGGNSITFTGTRGGIGIGISLPLGYNDSWTIPKDRSDRYVKL